MAKNKQICFTEEGIQKHNEYQKNHWISVGMEMAKQEVQPSEKTKEFMTETVSTLKGFSDKLLAHEDTDTKMHEVINDHFKSLNFALFGDTDLHIIGMIAKVNEIHEFYTGAGTVKKVFLWVTTAIAGIFGFIYTSMKFGKEIYAFFKWTH